MVNGTLRPLMYIFASKKKLLNRYHDVAADCFLYGKLPLPVSHTLI